MYNKLLYNLDYEVPTGKLIDEYRDSMRGILSRICVQLEPSEIEEAINYSVAKAYKAGKEFNDLSVNVHNNVTNRTLTTDLLSLSNEILTSQPILTGIGVLYKRHGARNPFVNFITYLVEMRDYAKSMMKKYPKGSEEYNAWDLKQKNYKVSVNAVYGSAGAPSCILYNIYLATSVTSQGRSCISASITLFEGLLGDNMDFANLTEVLQFIEFVSIDQRNPINRKFNDWDVLDRDITVEECFLRIMSKCKYNSWVPSDDARDAIWITICNLDQRMLNVLYYKNNMYEFCKNKRVMNLVLKMLTDLQDPFLNPNKPPEEIQDNIKMFEDLIYEYCYYRHIWIDKLERVHAMERNAVLITDTDSCIVCLDQWYKMVLSYTVGMPMNIKYTQEELKIAGDKIITQKRTTELTQEYDFYNDTLVEAKRKKYPLIVVEEDNLRFSIVNIMAYTISKLILDYMVLFSENYNSFMPDRDCLLIMKNEFLFKSLLLTFGAKNYASLQLVQEGNMVPENKQFDIKGMPISKVNIPDSTKKALKDILEYDILRSTFVDQVDIFRKLTVLEKQMYQSIRDKKKDFHKPARIKSQASYADPMTQQGIKASIAYNTIKDKDEELIDLDQQNSILIIKTKIDKKNVNKILESFPEHYIRMKKIIEENKAFRGSIDSIAIPQDIEIPDWLVPFIDYTTILQDNLRNFPLDELGMTKMDSSHVIKSNIIAV